MPRLTVILVAALLGLGCERDWDGAPPFDEAFEIPRGERFAERLSAYGLYADPPGELQPAAGVVPYELTSALFTDYAAKQRLVRVPAGTTATVGADGRLVFPEGTVLVKTFYYPDDLRAPDGPRRIIETRLLVKAAGAWNVATYVWDATQQDATLQLTGSTTDVRWLDAAGEARSTTYAVPHEGECVTCHQADGAARYIGPTLSALSRPVTRDGVEVDQLAYLASQGVLPSAAGGGQPALPDYRDATLPLASRGRAYLHMNCAHCHSPAAWGEAADRGLDLRYEAPLSQTGLARKASAVRRVMRSGEMPYLGTTVLDDAGVQLVLDYLNTL